MNFTSKLTLVFLPTLLLSCSQGNTDNVKIDNLSVTIGYDSINTLAISAEPQPQLIYNGKPIFFNENNLVIKLSNKDSSKNYILNQLQSLYKATIISNQQPAPPPPDFEGTVLNLPDNGFRLLKIDAPVVDLNQLSEKLRKAGRVGEFKFKDSKSASNYALSMSLSEVFGAQGLSANVDLLGRSQWAPENYGEQLRFGSYGSYTDFDVYNSRLVGAGSARDIYHANVPPKKIRAGLMIIDIGFDSENPDIMGFDPFIDTKSNLGGYRGGGRAYDSSKNTWRTGIVGSPSHGTRTAGVSIGFPGNRYGITGVYPEAAFDLWSAEEPSTPDYASYFNIAKGIRSAISYGDKTVNISIGGWQDSCSDYGGFISATNEATQAGTIVVVSAANNNAEISGVCMPSPNNPIAGLAYAFPAVVDNVIVVGAYDYSGNRSVWGSNWSQGIGGYSASNYGNRVDIFALGGGNTPNLPIPRDFCYSSNFCASVDNGNNQFSFNGTSQAAPIVAGIVGMLKELNPNLTLQQIRSALRNTSFPTNDPQVPRAINGKSLFESFGYSMATAKNAKIQIVMNKRGAITLENSQNASLYISRQFGRAATFYAPPGSYKLYARDFVGGPLINSPNVAISVPLSEQIISITLP